MKESFAKLVTKHRLRPWHLALCVLFVGWAPSLLLAYYSYNVLGRTLEDQIMADAQSLVGSISQHIGNELERTGEVMDYYRTLPDTAGMLAPQGAPAIESRTGTQSSTPNPHRHNAGMAASTPGSTGIPATSAANPTGPPATPQEWLARIFYPQINHIDGMFMTDATGRIIAVVPPVAEAQPGREFSAAPWKAAAERTDDNAGFHVSPIYPRSADGRPVVSVVVAVRDKAGTILGFLGADILIERLGRRLRAVEMISNDDTSLQIIDDTGQQLFTRTLDPNPPGRAPIDPALLRVYRNQRAGIDETNGRLHIFASVNPTGWIAVMERPVATVLQPVHDLLRQTLFLVAWLVLGTAVAAVLLGTFYRRQLASSLRIEREQIFNEKILANMPVGIALVDPAGERMLHVNSSFSEIIQSLGHLPRDIDPARATFTQLALASREALARVLHFGVPFQTVEQRTPTSSGHVRYLTTNLLRLQDNQQRTIGVLCLLEDGTHAVTLRQELINANTAKDQFLAQLSHELRNPLSPVITMVAELEVYTDALPATKQPLEIIRRNVELEARLIDDLLDVTRISSGKLQLSREAIDVHRTLRLALEICQSDIDEKRLHLELDLRAREHFAYADPARLQQVFWNLIKNAVKFTAEGRRLIVRSVNLAVGTASAAPVSARQGGEPGEQAHSAGSAAGGHGGASAVATSTAPLSSGENASFLRVEVIDEGIGIEPQHLRRIFNAFDQGQSTITQRFGGLGLGLAITKAMVEAHGGYLSVASEGAGKGATFTVELQTCQPPATVETEAPPTESSEVAAHGIAARQTSTSANGKTANGRGRHILLVDDHHDTCFGMQRLLNRRGYRVAVAHSVAEALACADASANGEAFDLLISDLGLPDGTGFDLMSELRRRGGPPGIALSGYGMESDVDKSRSAGFSEHLIKPVAIDRLEAAMLRLLGTEKT